MLELVLCIPGALVAGTYIKRRITRIKLERDFRSIARFNDLRLALGDVDDLGDGRR